MSSSRFFSLISQARRQGAQHSRRAHGALRRSVVLGREPQHIAHKVRETHYRRAGREEACAGREQQ